MAHTTFILFTGSSCWQITIKATLADAKATQNFPTTVCLTCQSIGGDAHCMTGEAKSLVLIINAHSSSPSL